MVKTIIRKRPVKSSEANPLGNPPPGDKTSGIDPAISLYALEEGENT